MLSSEKLREIFFDFFKKRGHKIIPSSSLIPDDQTSLFTSAGMQQLTPYLKGEVDVIKDFGTRHLASIQKCLRTGDIEEVGDETHHTFFEMMGNWSVGEDSETGYFKEGAIELALDFFVNILGLPKERFWITIFKGTKDIPRDDESFQLWQKYGIPSSRIREFGPEDNFWGPVTETGPCGPCSEIHYDRGEKYGCGRPDCGPNCPYCQRFVEVWNLVFMEYDKRVVKIDSEKKEYKYVRLPQRNVDTGIGFERLVALLQGKDSAYETDLFEGVIKTLEKFTSQHYSQNPAPFRVVADHMRAITFLVAEGVLPSNLERGYILRRLIRRSQIMARNISLSENWEREVVDWFINKYGSYYPEIKDKRDSILEVIEGEKEKFQKTINEGLKYLNNLLSQKQTKTISGEEAFFLFESFGLPLDITKTIASEKGFSVDEKEFSQKMAEHKEISRRGAEKKFSGVGIELLQSEEEKVKATRLHTATHLLHAALRKVLGNEVRQMGSDITPERLRFDFSFERKLTPEEIKAVEDLVNEKIRQNLVVKREEMPLKEALDSGALAFFKEKYPEVVSVYSIVDPVTGEVFSREVCRGPHAEQTGQLGRFVIKKEESSSRGVRRIKAVLED